MASLLPVQTALIQKIRFVNNVYFFFSPFEKVRKDVDKKMISI